MPYDLKPLIAYLGGSSPTEIAKTLDDVLYDLVVSAESLHTYEKLGDKYLSILLLRNQFMKMDKELAALWK